MDKAFKWFFVIYIMPIVDMIMISPFFIEHFLFKGNEYLLNYQKGYNILLTLVLIFLFFSGLITTILKYTNYDKKQIDNMRRNQKKTFISKYIYKPIGWAIILGLILIGKWYVLIVYMLLKPTIALVGYHQKRILAEYDKNIEQQSKGEVPLKAEFKVIE